MEMRYAREAIVGSLVIIAIVVFVLGTMWLSGRSIGNRDVVRVRFKHVSGLKRASPVTISGVQVGRVERIDLEDVGRVIVSISLPPRIVPRVDASARVSAVGLVGDYAIEFDPGRAAQPLPKDRIVIGSTKSGFGERAATLGDRADSLMVGLQEFANKETAEDLRGALRAFQGTMVQMERTLKGFGDANHGATAELTRSMLALQRLSARLDTTLANPRPARHPAHRGQPGPGDHWEVCHRHDALLRAARSVRRDEGVGGRAAEESGEAGSDGQGVLTAGKGRRGERGEGGS